MKKLFVALAAAAVLAGCAGGTTNQNFIVGDWALNQVIDTANNAVLDPETNASLYSEQNGWYTFAEDGNGTHTIMEAGSPIEQAVTWKKTSGNNYTISDGNGIDLEVTYESKDDALHRYYKAASEAETYSELEFVYTRKK